MRSSWPTFRPRRDVAFSSRPRFRCRILERSDGGAAVEDSVVPFQAGIVLLVVGFGFLQGEADSSARNRPTSSPSPESCRWRSAPGSSCRRARRLRAFEKAGAPGTSCCSTMRDVTLSDIERLNRRPPSRTISDGTTLPRLLRSRRTCRCGYSLAHLRQQGHGRRSAAGDVLRGSYVPTRSARARPTETAIRCSALPPTWRTTAGGVDCGRTWSHCPRGTRGAAELAAPTDVAGDAERRTDVHRALARLKPREREMLWLAYAQGLSASRHSRRAGREGDQRAPAFVPGAPEAGAPF